ncbi:uncharacterized protein LOC127710175 [Mytilus californianus]|uniref:uncharacterized protein LOC127710175 n=1 Tax=Mytilus californianus TaxID=6549 RepID=UPI002246126E|nr:uncharacterized protein LOC127710175 [Mytilus californianus]XP_052071904.1 uncharacterized protein LOC127710175 [Mytilus californianus]
MRTYKEPKRIDKARSREPGLVTHDEGISKLSALSVQVEEETIENSSDKEEEMIEDNDSGVQENHIDDEEPEFDNEKIEENKNDKDENHEKMEDVNVGISAKKKTPPKKSKKVVENNLLHNEDIDDIRKCEPEGEKRKQEPPSKAKKTTTVKEAKRRKMSDKKNDKSQASKDVLNNCVVDLGSKEKISPKSKNKSRSTKSKQKSNTTDDTDIDESHKEDSEKSSSFNTSDSLNVSPRSSKRTPVKNRKYQSDEELDPAKEEADSSGKKKRSRSKSPRCSTPKKRKLNFDENEFMNIKDDDFVIEKNDKDIDSVTNESTDNNKGKKVVKSRKNKSLIKEDIILKPKAVKKKAKLSQSEIKTSVDDATDKNESVEKVKDESLSIEESCDLKESTFVKVKKKKIRKKKTVENRENIDSAEIKSDKIEVKSESADNIHVNNEDITKTEKENDIKHNSEKPNCNNQGNNDGKSEKPIDNEKGEKKEKRKMKPLEEIVCTYCKKVSVGKAANTRHLKKCFVYQAKLEMQRQENENTELEATDDTKKDESHVECKDEDKTCVYSETINESNIECDDVSKENLNQSENQSEDKENLNDSLSSENKSIENQSSSKKRSKTDIIYNCQHCDYTAHKRAMLAKHLHSHNIFMCLRCSFFCESDDELKDHMHREHKERMDHKLCRKCSRYVHCADITLEQHMESCQGPVPFKCPHCEKEFKYESSLKSHILKHDPDGPKKFSCPQCSYKSNYKANLKKHLVNIHSSRIKQFKCTYEDCEKMFHSEDNMRRHLKWHSIDKPFKCKQCHKEFRTSGALSGHCVVHKTGTPYKCTVEDCEKSFRSHKLLKNHLQDFHHQAEKKFICAHSGCDFSFFKRSHLDRHLVTHSGERKYGCSYCGKAFRHADNLRVHLRQHTNEKPVSCNMCDFKCRQKSSLRYHLQKIHNIVFKKREKRKEKSASGDVVLKSENDITVNSLDSSLDLITAIVNAVAKSEDIATQNDTVIDKSNSAKTTTGSTINDDTKSDSPVANKVVDLYEFKSDDEFGDESVLVPLPLPVQRPINHLNKSNEKVDNKVKVEAKIANEDEPTDTEYPDNKDSIEKIETPKPKVVRRGKKKKINYAEPETDLSFETVDAKDENIKKEEKEENVVVKRKRGPRKSKLKVEKVEEEKKEEDEKCEITPKGRRGRKKVEKIPKKRGRKPKSVIVEENSKKAVVKSPINKIKKKAGRPRKVRPPSESEEDKKKEETKDDESNHDENDSEKEEDETIPREDEHDDDTVDVPLLSTPNPDEDDDDTREYIGDENLKENAHLVSILENKQSEKEDEEEIEVKTKVKPEAKTEEKTEVKTEAKTEAKTEEKKEEPQIENESSVVEKQSEHESDKMSSGIDTDFEDDLKPPPAPRPPPVVDSDEGDIESGPDEMDTPGRDFESTPPKSNITEHIHSVPAHTPRDFESSPPKSVQTSDYGPSTLSQTGFENKREGDSVEALSGSYTATPSREVSVEENRDEREVSLPYSNLESENLPNTQSPVMEPIQPEPQSNANPDYGSQSESTMPEVDKEYLGQYLQQFDSASRSEDDRIERMNSQNEQTSEPIDLPSSPQKDLPPLNLSANAPPLNLSTNSNDRENSQGSDMSNKRMEILSIDRQTEDHYSSRSENVSRSSDRIPDNVYESISSMNTFMPPTTREAPIIHSAESPFPSVSTPSTFMRFSENDAILQRQRMTTPFLSQGDPNALQNLHRMADNALAQHNNASLLRRPTTVPPREDMFSSSTAAMANMARNPFHNTWASQEVRPAHWSQSPYLGRSIDRPTAAPSTIFGKDNYLPGREFMFEPSRRAVTDRNVFPGLPQTQRPELAHDTFSMDRFDIGSYFSGHTYPGASTLTEYNRAAAAHTSQKTFDERYRQSSTGITDFRALPQTTASSMFSSNMLNSSFHLDKYMYSRDPVYHAQHIPDATNSPFLPPGVPGQHSVFDREYTRGYFQNSPYSLDKQYAAAAAASAKLSHPSGASVVQERDFVPRPGTAAATGENQEAYRHPMLYNMMNHRFYE